MEAKRNDTLSCEAAQRLIMLTAMAAEHAAGQCSAFSKDAPDYPERSSSSPTTPEEILLAALLFEDHAAHSVATTLPTESPDLAEHLEHCAACRAEYEETTTFFEALASAEQLPEPSAALLAQARHRLDSELDQHGQANLWVRFTQQLSFSAGRLRAAPALCSALLVIGVAAGGYGGYRLGLAAHVAEQNQLLLAPAPPEAPSVVADVSSVTRDERTGTVEVRYDRLVPDMLTAPLDDPSIRELLMAAAENGIDANVRNSSVALLSHGCLPTNGCEGDGPIRNALMNALRSDKTPEVRRQALAGLQPFIATDMDVRDAVLGALLNDPSASVRGEAIHLLKPVDVDSSVRLALHAAANSDGDPAIRSASMEALRTLPAVQ